MQIIEAIESETDRLTGRLYDLRAGSGGADPHDTDILIAATQEVGELLVALSDGFHGVIWATEPAT